MKVRTSYQRCEISVLGVDMECPFCGVTVHSGETHECEKPQAIEGKGPSKKSLKLVNHSKEK